VVIVGSVAIHTPHDPERFRERLAADHDVNAAVMQSRTRVYRGPDRR
jgi:hypothetical protein